MLRLRSLLVRVDVDHVRDKAQPMDLYLGAASCENEPCCPVLQQAQREAFKVDHQALSKVPPWNGQLRALAWMPSFAGGGQIREERMRRTVDLPHVVLRHKFKLRIPGRRQDEAGNSANQYQLSQSLERRHGSLTASQDASRRFPRFVKTNELFLSAPGTAHLPVLRVHALHCVRQLRPKLAEVVPTSSSSATYTLAGTLGASAVIPEASLAKPRKGSMASYRSSPLRKQPEAPWNPYLF